MKQNAVVVSCDGKYASVRVDRQSMCSGCHKGCSDACALYKIFGAKTEFEAKAVNKAGAEIGDRVVVEASDSTVNLNAFFVFLLPVIISAAVYLLTFSIEAEAHRIAFAVLSFIVYFAILVIVEKVKKTSSALYITEVTERGTKNE